jgi:alcohol dehydrogenase
MNLLNGFSFELPTKIKYGTGAVRKLAEALREQNATSVLVVTDPGIVSSGLLSRITSRLGREQ